MLKLVRSLRTSWIAPQAIQEGPKYPQVESCFADVAVSMDNVNIDSEAEDAIDSDGSRPGQQVFSTQINQEKPNLPLVQWVLMMWHSTWIWRLDL